MTSVITSSAPAEKRVARPQSSSAGKRCSEKAVSGTATAGSSGRPENSLRNRSYCDGSIRRKLPSTIFVCPDRQRSEEHTSELQSLMRISYAGFCLKKKKLKIHMHNDTQK